MKKIVLIVIFLNSFLYAQIPQYTVVPLTYPPTGQLINQDSSIVFDTTGAWYPSANCDSSFWNNTGWHFYPEAMEKVYAKKFWDVRFDVPAIPLDSVRSDSLLYVTLNAIDSINYPNIKNGFKQLESNYGNYRLRKINPSETTGDDSQYFSLYFDNYVKIQEVTYNIDTMEHVYCEFENWPPLQGYIPENDVGMTPGNSIKDIYLNNTDIQYNYYESNYHRLGFQHHHYYDKTPMAWEITKGDPFVFIGAVEQESLNEINHPDIVENFRHFCDANQNMGDGTTETNILPMSHGLETISCAIADDNNANSQHVNPMVGACPDCKGFLTFAPCDYRKIDVDENKNYVITPPRVAYALTSEPMDPFILISSGMVCLGVAGNDLEEQGGELRPVMADAMHRNYIYDNEDFDPDETIDRNKIFKVISVSGLADGDLYNSECYPCGPYESGRNWQGNECFVALNNYDRVFNFSISIDKFGDALEKRDSAFVDITVPAIGIFTAHLSNKEYMIENGGTCMAVPAAAGVVGLMRALNLNLSAELAIVGGKLS